MGSLLRKMKRQQARMQYGDFKEEFRREKRKQDARIPFPASEHSSTPTVTDNAGSTDIPDNDTPANKPLNVQEAVVRKLPDHVPTLGMFTKALRRQEVVEKIQEAIMKAQQQAVRQQEEANVDKEWEEQ